MKGLENLFLMAEISEGADVGNDEGYAELIVGAHLAEGDTAIFERQAATFSVVADLHELVLQSAIRDVVADAGDGVEAATGFAAIAEEHADLIGERLENGIVLQAKMGDGGEKFAIGF